MSPKTTTALRLDSELLQAMRQVKHAQGIPVTTQIEMAVREWLAKRRAIRPGGNVRTTRKAR
jgi:hypothetical protein